MSAGVSLTLTVRVELCAVLHDQHARPRACPLWLVRVVLARTAILNECRAQIYPTKGTGLRCSGKAVITTAMLTSFGASVMTLRKAIQTNCPPTQSPCSLYLKRKRALTISHTLLCPGYISLLYRSQTPVTLTPNLLQSPLLLDASCWGK